MISIIFIFINNVIYPPIFNYHGIYFLGELSYPHVKMAVNPSQDVTWVPGHEQPPRGSSWSGPGVPGSRLVLQLRWGAPSRGSCKRKQRQVTTVKWLINSLGRKENCAVYTWDISKFGTYCYIYVFIHMHPPTHIYSQIALQRDFLIAIAGNFLQNTRDFYLTYHYNVK